MAAAAARPSSLYDVYAAVVRAVSGRSFFYDAVGSSSPRHICGSEKKKIKILFPRESRLHVFIFIIWARKFSGTFHMCAPLRWTDYV